MKAFNLESFVVHKVHHRPLPLYSLSLFLSRTTPNELSQNPIVFFSLSIHNANDFVRCISVFQYLITIFLCFQSRRKNTFISHGLQSVNPYRGKSESPENDIMIQFTANGVRENMKSEKNLDDDNSNNTLGYHIAIYLISIIKRRRRKEERKKHRE